MSPTLPTNPVRSILNPMQHPFGPTLPSSYSHNRATAIRIIVQQLFEFRGMRNQGKLYLQQHAVAPNASFVASIAVLFGAAYFTWRDQAWALSGVLNPNYIPTGGR